MPETVQVLLKTWYKMGQILSGSTNFPIMEVPHNNVAQVSC